MFKVNLLACVSLFVLVMLPINSAISEEQNPPLGWGHIMLTYPGEPYSSIDVDMDDDGEPEYTDVNIYNSVLTEIQQKCCQPRHLDSIDCNSYLQVLMNKDPSGKVKPAHLRIQYSSPGTDRTFTCQGKEIMGIEQVPDPQF